MDCSYSKKYFHLVQSTSEPFSHAICLQHHVWLCSPIVLMPGIRILYAGCFQQPSCFIIIIIIITIIIDLITHLSIYVLVNLHLSQTVGGIGTVRVKKFNLSLRLRGRC
jgi:hypothetical protein